MIVGMWSLQKNYLPLIEWKDWDLWFIIELLQECISYHISKLCCKIYSCDFCHTSDQIFIFLSFCNLVQFTSQSISYISLHIFLILIWSGRHYYEQALRVRQQIYNDFQTIFSKNHKNKKETVDIILTPVTLSSAPSVKRMKEIGPVESSIYDTYTVVVNLAG